MARDTQPTSASLHDFILWCLMDSPQKDGGHFYWVFRGGEGEGEEQGQSLPKFEFLFKVDFFELYHDIKNILIYKMNCNLKLP